MIIIKKMTHKSVSLDMTFEDFEALKRLAERGLEAMEVMAKAESPIAKQQIEGDRAIIASILPGNRRFHTSKGG